MSVSAVFFVLIIFNFILDARLNALARTRDDYVLEIEINSEVEKRAIALTRQLELYKRVRDTIPPISGHIDQILAALNKHVAINSFSYVREESVYTFRSTAPTASTYAFLIADLLEVEEVDSITIISVSLDAGADEYNATLDINLKE